MRKNTLMLNFSCNLTALLSHVDTPYPGSYSFIYWPHVDDRCFLYSAVPISYSSYPHTFIFITLYYLTNKIRSNTRSLAADFEAWPPMIEPHDMCDKITACIRSTSLKLGHVWVSVSKVLSSEHSLHESR